MSLKKIVLLFAACLLITVFTQPAYAKSFSDKKPAEIQLAVPGDLQHLIRTGIIIDTVSKPTVNVYISPDEFSILEKAGFSIRWVPNYAKLAHDNYFNNNVLRKEKADGLNYPTYAELTSILTTIASDYPEICKLESAGKSVQGNELWWFKITDNVNIEEAEPEVHYMSTLHGDEPVGTVLCLELIKYLTSTYASNNDVKNIVDTTEIWIMPLMNPDGYDAGERFNADGDDLNRSFPDPSTEGVDACNSTEGKPLEVAAIMNWSLNHTPVLGASFHTGALVVNYPFDYTQMLCPDDDLFEYISLKYSEQNVPMSNLPYPSYATDGIVRGPVWYEIAGGLQDWTYLATGANHVTIELNRGKWPETSELTGLWIDNQESMMAYLETAHFGVKGIVTDQNTGEPVSAWVRVEEIDHVVYTDPDVGDFHRMLLPGDYNLIVRADGYSPFSQQITISDGSALTLAIKLEPGDDTSEDTGKNWPTDTNNGDNTSGGGSSTPVPDGNNGGGCFITLIEANF